MASSRVEVRRVCKLLGLYPVTLLYFAYLLTTGIMTVVLLLNVIFLQSSKLFATFCSPFSNADGLYADVKLCSLKLLNL